MSDSRPEPDEPGGTSPASGARRSGLDRLRAARGGADAPAAAAPADRGSPETPTAERAGGERGAGRGSGSTALLETDPERDDTAELTEPDAAPERGRGGARRGRRTAVGAGAAAGGAKANGKRTGTSEAPARPAARLQIVAVVVLALLVIGLAIPVVLMRHRIIGQSGDAKAVSNLVEKRTEATGTARRFAVTFFTTDYKTIDQYSDQVAALSTGAFLTDFNSKRAQLKSLTTQAQSQATGRVLTSGVSKVAGDTVEVLVVADQSITNATTKGKAPTVQRYRVRVTVQKTPKGWLVSGLDPVG